MWSQLLIKNCNCFNKASPFSSFLVNQNHLQLRLPRADVPLKFFTQFNANFKSFSLFPAVLEIEMYLKTLRRKAPSAKFCCFYRTPSPTTLVEWIKKGELSSNIVQCKKHAWMRQKIVKNRLNIIMHRESTSIFKPKREIQSKKVYGYICQITRTKYRKIADLKGLSTS